MLFKSAVALLHFEIARIFMRARLACGKLIESVGIREFLAVDEDLRPHGGVDRCKHYPGGVFSAPHHHIRVGEHIGVEFVDTHIADVHVSDEVGEGFALSLAYVVLQLCQHSDGRYGRHVVEELLLPFHFPYRAFDV